MAALKFASSHNMVAFLDKPTESDGFEQIVDFLNAHPIKYALTVNLTIYIACIEQFWATTKVKTVNGEVQIQALADKEKNLEGGVKFLMYPRFVQVFLDKQVEGMSKHKKIYVTPSHTKKVFANMKRQGKDFSGRDTPLFPTMIVQAQEQFREELCTNLSQRFLDLENTKTSQAAEITKLKERVKKLERRNKSRTPGLKRLRKVSKSAQVVSSEDEGLGAQEDASKQGRKIADLDADVEVTLVDEARKRNDDNLMFDTRVFDEEEVEVEKVVSTAEVTTVSATTTTVDELTLAQTLIEIKAAKPKLLHETTTTAGYQPKLRVVVKEP
ncbi:hypothetical protein Tco_0250573 [Tanacetum coccineum]